MKFSKKKSKFSLGFIIGLTFAVLMVFASDLEAKHRKRGVQMAVYKTDGSVLKGELLSVKASSLLLMTPSATSGENIAINEIKKFKIIRKGKLLKHIGFGFVAGAAIGAILQKGSDGEGLFSPAVVAGILGAAGGGVAGIFGAFSGIDRVCRVHGRPPGKVRAILSKLCGLARFGGELGPRSGAVDSGSLIDPYSPPKFHLTLTGGSFNSSFVDDSRSLLGQGNWSQDNVSPEAWDFPDKQKVFLFKNAGIEYSLNKRIALGFLFSRLGEQRMGKTFVEDVREPDPYSNGTVDFSRFGDVNTSGKGNAFFATASYALSSPDSFLNNSAFKIGVGAGLSRVEFSADTAPMYSDGLDIENCSFHMKKVVPSFLLFAEFDHFFSQHVSLGLRTDYKYIPVSIDEFEVDTVFRGGRGADQVVAMSFPSSKVNYGGIGVGICLGLHF
ncbi:MAG: hypothetical protein GY757_34625 [bacterium]|nr:hypothetical protein [bacterium]